MTSKTGNFKSFDKFCRMMYSSLQSNNNGTVFIDLLTYQDLEILKSRKAAKSGQQPTTLNATQRTKNKRYLILTYVVEFDRVHYPLALKMDETSLHQNRTQTLNVNQDQNRNPNIDHKERVSSSRELSRCGPTETTRKLLNASHASSSSVSSATTSRTASPRTRPMSNWRGGSERGVNAQNPRNERTQGNQQNAHYQSTPNLNAASIHTVGAKRNGVKVQSMTSYQSPNPNPLGNAEDVENARMDPMVNEDDQINRGQRSLVKQRGVNGRDQGHCYPSDKFSEIIESLEDENKILKNELEKKNLEIRRMTRSNKQYQKKHIAKRLDDLEDEIERLSTELLSERTKNRRLSRDFQAERAEMNKNVENLEASVDHFKRKCRGLRDELKSTKETLENVRLKASKQRLYASTKSLNDSTSSLRRSRSRIKNNNKRNVNAPKARNGRSNSRSNSRYYKQKEDRKQTRRPRSRSNSALGFQRSSSASRISSNKRRSNGYGGRSRSPSIRFDPTEWAKKRKDQIAKAKMRNTFGTSRSPSPYRRTSRSVSPNRARNKSKSGGLRKKRDRSRSSSRKRKRNSFGSTIPSKSPKQRENRRNSSGNMNPRLPLPASSWRRNDDENDDDLKVLNSMERRKQRILSMNRKGNDSRNVMDDDDDDDDDESVFNPTTEIESIDSRLNALQKFLRAAKSAK